MEGGELISVFQSKIRPTSWDKFKISIEALSVQVDGITDPEKGADAMREWWAAMLAAPLTKNVAVDFGLWITQFEAQHLPIVAQKASFDTGFLDNWLFQQRSSCPRPLLSPVTICTQVLAQRLLPTNPKHSLDALCDHFGMGARTKAHEAADDAIRCGQIYFHLRALTPAKDEALHLAFS